MRARVELQDNVSDDSNRSRLRTRVRFGATFDMGEEWMAGIRARTGKADNPNNPYQDLGSEDGGLFGSFDLKLDQAYVTYSPSKTDGLAMTFGKFAQPMRRNPVYGEFMWDQDVQPEGVQFTWDRPEEEGAWKGGGATLGQYLLLESSTGADLWSTFAQVYGATGLGQAGRLDGALAYYYVGDTSPGGAASPLLPDNRGNAIDGTDFASDFGVVNPLLAWSLKAWTVSAEMFNNFRAAEGVPETGYTLGASWKTQAGYWYCTYAVVGQDAIFSPWTQDDFLLGTNMASSLIGWKKPLSEFITVHVWAMSSVADEPDLGGPDETVYRFRIDLDFLLL